jgi:acetyl esterase
VGPFTDRLTKRVISSVLGAAPRLTGAPLPKNDRGDTLDPHVATLLKAAVIRAPLESLPVGRARAEFDESAHLMDVPKLALASVRDEKISGPHGPIPIRIYDPSDPARRDAQRPLVVWLHGGGFVIGGLRSHDRALRYVASQTGAVVVAVDYRLSPEHKFPVCYDDALAAVRWAGEHARLLGADATRMAIGGDSAGGNLTATTCLLLRDLARAGQKVPAPKLQVLVYPATDLRRQTESHRLLSDGYLLSKPLIDFFMGHFLRSKDDERDWRGSPLLASDHRDLPRAWVGVAGFDPLRDEGEQYAQKLRDAGVRTELCYEPSLVHGWLSMGGIVPAARRAVDTMCRAIRDGV